MQVSHEDAGLQFSRLSAQAAKAAHNARMAKKRGRSDEEESCEGDGATSGGVSVGDGFHATFAASFASHGALQTRRDVFTPHKLGDALASVETQTPPKQTSRQQNHQQNHHRLKQSESQPQTVRLPASSCTEPESAKEPDTAPRDRTGASARKLFTSRHPDTPVANRVRFDYSASTPTPRKKNPTFGLCDRAIAVPLTDKAKLKYDLAVNAPAHGHYAYFGTPVSAASASGSNANNPADPNANVNGGSNQSATGTASDSRKDFARSVHAATLFTTLTGLPVHDMPICPTSSTLVRRLTANPATTSLSPTPSSRTANSSAASRSQFLSFCTKPESFPATQTSDLLLSRASPCLPGGGSARNNTATSVLTLRAGGGSSFASPSPQRKRRDLLLEADSCLETQQVLRRASKLQPRSILRSPYKVLDAPELQDDFYLNLVDWSGSNILGVGLGSCVYLWNAASSKVTKLCDLAKSVHANGAVGDTVTSVCWNPKGSMVAIGTNRGVVEVWDVEQERKIRDLTGHESRVGSIAWSGDTLTTGSRDRSIHLRDTRAPHPSFAALANTLTAHRQEVCGLKWSVDDTLLASGGNDNRLLVWDRRALGSAGAGLEPLHTFREHAAAVKAIAWSPHCRGLLASGGGTADQKIRFWRTSVSGSGAAVGCWNTQSQVCNLAWSQKENEVVSTHGFSQNQVVVWKVEGDGGGDAGVGISPLATLTGHTMRVLYLAVSPDNQNIVTGAGDETLRFWSVFGKVENVRKDEENGAGGLTIR